ncbi:MAG: S46 family peptidase [Saprospiraceae bacterium]|nr:S46 family peptidase [Saprospiraceae bacterium]
MKNYKVIALVALVFTTFSWTQAQQDDTPKRFDFGKMWTFENPPKDWFVEAYDFHADEEWFSDVRKSALRFATWCSASFVSPDGLIMTNHHCSRSVVGPLQKEGESFDDEGFYAETRQQERKADGLFVEQLLMVSDITDRVHSVTRNISNPDRQGEVRDSILAIIQAEFSEKDSWKDLRLQVVTYYSGGKYSLYGYKKYDDIRLVMIPELQLGFYGGDPDNFTYPRYNLDCTFWRAYDENGDPVNSSANYYRFNTDGVHENEPVFVVGNPGRTERYRTVAQLEYDRDIRYPVTLEYLKNRHEILSEQYQKNPDNDQLLNQIFSLGNTIKAYTGILNGLQDNHFFGRKIKMEKSIRDVTKDESPWENLEGSYEMLSKHGAAVTLLGPGPLKGAAVNLMHEIYAYQEALTSEEANEETLEEMRASIRDQSGNLDDPLQKKYFKTFLQEISKFSPDNNDFSSPILEGRSPKKAAMEIMDETWFNKEKKLDKILNLNSKKFMKCDDPLIEAAREIVPTFNEAVRAFRGTSATRDSYEQEVANAVFKVKGTDLPPDATFTLRIADGVVKGYEYNGTVAPIKTTYFGMYDRHYSNDKEFPWSLPEKWDDPSLDLLKSPLNFVSTNDIIGGNSGSAIINRAKEAVGLIFDGNIESLPGNFIFDEEHNRSVSVHAGGIVAALKHVYSADRLVEELTGMNE